MNEIKKLIEGFQRFRAHHYERDGTPFQQLVSQGQSPKIMVIACCDSRVDPAIITDSDPGDLFVVRNVANLVPPFEQGGGYHGTSAALEFAVRCLNVQHVIVMGHEHCGGIRALLGNIRFEGNAGQFIAPHGIAVDSHGDIYVGEVSRTQWAHIFPQQPPPTDLRSLRKFRRVAVAIAP